MTPRVTRAVIDRSKPAPKKERCGPCVEKKLRGMIKQRDIEIKQLKQELESLRR